MKVYKVRVNGKVYEVELEAVSENDAKIETTKAVAAAPVASTGERKEIVAPISGKVLDVKVSVGDVVKAGQTVAIIEAMKLENEVPSTAEGKVVEIKVSKGNNVNTKDVLIVLG